MNNLKKQLETMDYYYNELYKDIKSYIKHRRLERILITGISAFLTVIILRLIF